MPADYEAQVIAVRDALGCLPDDDTTTRATEVYAARDRAWIDLKAVREENAWLRSLLAERPRMPERSRGHRARLAARTRRLQRLLKRGATSRAIGDGDA